MNALEAARDILGTDLVEASDYASSCPFCGGEMRRGADKERWHVGFDHHPDCSWLAMPQIVKALEAAEQFAMNMIHCVSDYAETNIYICGGCGRSTTWNAEKLVHDKDCAGLALKAILA